MNALTYRAALLIAAAALALQAGCASGPEQVAAPTDCTPQGRPSPTPYLGCANRLNLQAMASAADLAEGRTLSPADGARQARAVEAYQKGETHKTGSDAVSSTTADAGSH